MRTPAQRGRYGQWLVASRVARGYDTAEKALRAMAAAGISIAKSTYAEYEAGSKPPSRNHLPLLEGFWGAAPEIDAPDATDQGELVAALVAQTAAISELVSLIRSADEAREARLRALEAEVRSLRELPAAEASRGRSAPRATVG